MKIKSGFLLRKVAGSEMAVPIGSRTVDIHGIIALNETGAFLWRLLEQDRGPEELAAALAREFEVDLERACADVSVYLASLQEQGLIEP